MGGRPCNHIIKKMLGVQYRNYCSIPIRKEIELKQPLLTGNIGSSGKIESLRSSETTKSPQKAFQVTSETSYAFYF